MFAGLAIGFIDFLDRPSSFAWLIISLLTTVNTLIIPVILLVITVQFFWGAFLYLIPGLDGNQLARRKGRIHMAVPFFMFIIIILFWGSH